MDGISAKPSESGSPVLNRRNFIRLAGGGTATALLAGCSTTLPTQAVEAWAGPPATLEPRAWALSHAILAPSSHNLQPWRVDLRTPDALTLHVDRDRLLPETDPWYRQIMVSQGSFLELLVIALKQRGLSPVVELFPEGEFAARELDERPVARVHWDPSAPAATPDPLFAQLLQRHTAKVAHDRSRPVDAQALAALNRAVPADAPAYLRLAGSADPSRVAGLRQLALDAARVEVGTPRTAMESNRLMRVGPDEISQHRDGIALNDWMPRMAVALGLFDRSLFAPPGSSGFDTIMKRYEAQAGSAMAFNWITTAAPPGAGRSAEVWAGRAFVRQQLAANALGLQVHPLSQALQEFPEMRPHYDKLHRRLTGASAGGAVVQMFCRVGFCAPQPHTPRRPLGAFTARAQGVAARA